MTTTAVVRPGPQLHSDHPAEVAVTFRSIRPSLLDLRFSGDAWVVQRREGQLVLCLGDSPLARIAALSLDQASLNTLLNRARHSRPRWRLTRRRPCSPRPVA